MANGDLGEALYRAIARTASGHRASMATEPGNFGQALKFFMNLAGGNLSAAARLAGVPRRSMRDWVAGKSKPGRDRAQAITESARLSSRQQRLSPRREARLRSADSEVILKGRYNYDGGDDRQPIRIGDYLAAGTLDRCVTAYLNGADEAELRATFTDGITDDWYQRTMSLPPTDDHGWTVSSITI